MYLEDRVIRLREFGTDIIHRLPQPPWDSAVIGSSEASAIQVNHAAAEHAIVERDSYGWVLRELGGEVRVDGVRRSVIRLDPGIEITIGEHTLIAEGCRCIELRSFMSRLLGWSRSPVVDRAMRSIRLAATYRASLVMCGPGDIVAVAYAIHRRTFPGSPFIMCDPRRRERDLTVRSVRNIDGGIPALRKAIGGSLCLWTRRLPEDLADVCVQLQSKPVQLILCSDYIRYHKPYYTDEIIIPKLSTRQHEIVRIIDEYADETAMDFAVKLNAADRDWILRNSAATLPAIENGTRRLLAIRNHEDNVAAAARALGMAQVSLSRWIGRRALPERRL